MKTECHMHILQPCRQARNFLHNDNIIVFSEASHSYDKKKIYDHLERESKSKTTIGTNRIAHYH